jgi:hypothetical protein
VTVAISGFVAGGAIGAFAGDYLVSQSSSYGSDTDLTILLIALISAVVTAWFAVKLINVVAFLLGFAYFAVGAGLIMVLQNADQDSILGAAVVMGIVGGILAVVLLRPTVTLSTALSGAALITLGAQTLGVLPADDSVALVAILVLAGLGVIIQYGLWKPQQAPQVPAGQPTGMHPPGPSTPSSPSPPAPLPGAASPSAPGAAGGTGSVTQIPTPPMGTSLSPDTTGTNGERFCPECGIQLDATSIRFCNQCGALLS